MTASSSAVSSVATASSADRSPWQDRWNQPTLKELLNALGKPLGKTVDKLIQRIDELAGVEHTLTWYGPSWKWTIEFTVPSETRGQRQPLAYLVPNMEGPIVSVPVSQPLMDQLRPKRLRRYLKDGLESAKHSVDHYWATWTFANQSEIDLLFEVIEKKHAYLTGDEG